MAKVLVLDDVQDAVNLMKRILKATGHEFVGFTEEEEALNYARSNPVDLAILDIKMGVNKFQGRNKVHHGSQFADEGTVRQVQYLKRLLSSIGENITHTIAKIHPQDTYDWRESKKIQYQLDQKAL
jgi:CheY-like chemotaxis protein